MEKVLNWIATVVCMAVVFFVGTALANTQGTCGDSLTWELDDEGKLIISGEGMMSIFQAHLQIQVHRGDSPDERCDQ